MKTIGLIGGMSWESSHEYYKLINEMVKTKLGRLNSAECIMYSVNFEEIEQYQSEGKWEEAGIRLAEIAEKLQTAGADMVLLCTNTMHKVADQIKEAIEVPFIHIGEATASEIKKAGLKKVALLGTKYTMEGDFYNSKITDLGVDVLTPNQVNRSYINQVIFDELCLGQFNDSSKNAFLKIIENLKEQGAEGVVLGCTEIPLLIKQEDSPLPLFNTMEIHAKKAVELALEK